MTFANALCGACVPEPYALHAYGIIRGWERREAEGLPVPPKGL